MDLYVGTLPLGQQREHTGGGEPEASDTQALMTGDKSSGPSQSLERPRLLQAMPPRSDLGSHCMSERQEATVPFQHKHHQIDEGNLHYAVTNSTFGCMSVTHSFKNTQSLYFLK